MMKMPIADELVDAQVAFLGHLLEPLASFLRYANDQCAHGSPFNSRAGVRMRNCENRNSRASVKSLVFLATIARALPATASSIE